jgi:hypothetical protein
MVCLDIPESLDEEDLPAETDVMELLASEEMLGMQVPMVFQDWTVSEVSLVKRESPLL